MIMKGLFWGIAAALTAVPALAAVQAAPVPALGLGLPAILALAVTCLIALVLKHAKT
jgi:hypothetical protein